MDSEGKREELEALIASEGWKRFVAYAEDEWTGPAAYKRRVKHAIGSVPQSEIAESIARGRLIQTEAVIEAIEALLRWPKQELDRAKFLDAQELAKTADTWRSQRRVP